MLARCVGLTLLVGLLAAVMAAPAAGHYPTHHDAAKLAFGDTFLGQLGAQTETVGSARCENGMAGIYPCKNVDLESFVALPILGGATGNDIWGWTDGKSKREFAIMGTSTSTGFVEVTDPKNPVLIGTLPTRGTPDYVLWRDIKVDGHYAFIVSEISGSGLQVFDLRRLLTASAVTPAVFTSDATYDAFSYAHNVSINQETDVAYVVGSNTCGVNGENGGLHMVDISKPLAPRFAGCATVGTFSKVEPNNYVHDVECVVYRGPDADYQGREICFGSNENVVAIYDVTDKANPRVISTIGYPQATYTHQGSLTADQRWFLFGDELDEQGKGQNTTTYILDAADLDQPPTPAAFAHATKSIDHNQYVHGQRTYQSNYTAGLRILKFDDASLSAGELDEVAFFDVVPGVDIAEFAGTWSNYRFPRTGTTVVSTIENEVSGLFVLKPTLKR
ncbi:MAG: choice-of-anchor B family protein [Chloroflexota bacterium]|nr:choice-of-anchor B family protein [Chloroflexota bacterium]